VPAKKNKLQNDDLPCEEAVRVLIGVVEKVSAPVGSVLVRARRIRLERRAVLTLGDKLTA